MRIRFLYAALTAASIFAGVMSAALEGWPPNPPGNSPQFQNESEIQFPLL